MTLNEGQRGIGSAVSIDQGEITMPPPEFEVQKANLTGQNWKTICRGPEENSREIFQRQLKLYSVGRFRLVDANGKVIEDRKALPLFSDN